MLNNIDLSRADLNLLVVFEAVLAERHVGRAAERLSLTPSAVSHGLGRLRDLFLDPLFVRTPKGVVPTERASEMAAPIADILARVRSVLSIAEPFEPATSTRRFKLGAPDGAAGVFLPRLLQELGRNAPSIDIGVLQLLPVPREPGDEEAWRVAFQDLESRALDMAIIPTSHAPARFHTQPLYDEDFVIAMRAGHPFARRPTLDQYCRMQHLVVSLTGDTRGFVDEALAKQHRSRRIALTVPNFMFALALVADTDLICAMPRRFVATHASSFGIVAREPPLPLPRFSLHAVAPKAALMDAGLAWLFELATKAAGPSRKRRPHSREKQ